MIAQQQPRYGEVGLPLNECGESKMRRALRMLRAVLFEGLPEAYETGHRREREDRLIFCMNQAEYALGLMEDGLRKLLQERKG